MSLPRDLVEMLAAFGVERVRYLVIGGHAVSLHARPRSTKDLDVLLDAAPDNVAAACRALIAFGVPGDLVAQLRTAGPTDILWLGRPPARVDLLLSAPAIAFDEAYERRVVQRLGGVDMSFIGKADLIANKRAVDLRDVRALLAPPSPRERKRAPRKKVR